MEQPTILSFHRVELNEAETLAALIRTIFEEYRDVLNPPSSAHHETAESITRKLQNGGAFIAELNGKAVGCVVYEIESDYLYLGRLGVLPEARRYGIASALVKEVEKAANQHNLTRIQLGVRLVLESNRRLFERLGFEFYAHGYHEGHIEPTFATLQKTVTR